MQVRAWTVDGRWAGGVPCSYAACYLLGEFNRLSPAFIPGAGRLSGGLNGAGV